MKKLISILLLLAGTAYADWKLNPYTQRQDYYEATGALITSTGTINTALNAEIARATARENAIAVSTGTLGSRVGAAEAALSTAAYTTNSYANPAWITSMASSKLSGTVPTGLVDLSTVATALDGKLTAPATFYVVKASDYLQAPATFYMVKNTDYLVAPASFTYLSNPSAFLSAPATSYWVKTSDYLQAPATFYVVPASAYLQNPATFYIATSADLSAKVSKAGDTMTGPLTLSGSSLTVTGALGLQVGAYAGLQDSANSSDLTNNLYYSTGWKYRNSSAASLLEQYAGDFFFYTAPSGSAGNAATLTERMKIANTGAVTIPGSSFSVGGSTLAVSAGKVSIGANLDIQDTSIHTRLTSNNGGGIQLSPASKDVAIYNGSADYQLSIYNGAINAVNFRSNGVSYINGGNVGIGTSSPYAALLDVRGNIATSGQVISSGTAGNYFAGIVGIGVVPGNVKFDVAGGRSRFTAGAEPYAVQLGRSDINAGVGVYLGSDNNSVSAPDFKVSNNNGTEILRVTNGGLVGINTSVPVSSLTVNGSFQTLKTKESLEGGHLVMMLNNESIAVASGTVVNSTGTTEDYSFKINPVGGAQSWGAVYGSTSTTTMGSCAAGTWCWVCTSGLCAVNVDSNGCATRGLWMGASNVSAGTAECVSEPANANQHDREIGHNVKAAAGGQAWMMAQFGR